MLCHSPGFRPPPATRPLTGGSGPENGPKSHLRIARSFGVLVVGAICLALLAPAPLRAQTNCDSDGDGVDSIACGGADCDDSDPRRFPGNVEVCDAENLDEDCDSTTFGDRDADGDGYVDAACCNEQSDGTLRCGDDCDDFRPSVHPGATETCNYRDDDCDGGVDWDHADLTILTFSDADEDGWGDGADPGERLCPADRVNQGRAIEPGDCNDADGQIHPTAPEVCNGSDDDCDGLVDEGFAESCD